MEQIGRGHSHGQDSLGKGEEPGFGSYAGSKPPSPGHTTLIWAAASCLDLHPLFSRCSSKQTYQVACGLPQGKRSYR